MNTTIIVFSDVDTPSSGFSTTTVSPAKEELGPGWAMDDVYPPLAELRRALLTDEEWAAMSSWEKDVWEMYYRPDWERLACIEQILVDTPAAQRKQVHEEILEALRNLGASATRPASAAGANSCIVHLDTAPTAIEEGPEVACSAVTGFSTTVPVTCSTDCPLQHSMAAPVLVAAPPSTPTEYVLDINMIHVGVVPLAMTVEFPVVAAPTDSAPTVQLQQLYNDSEFFMLPTSSQCITTKVAVHRPMPWPSFVAVHALEDEARPLPWPSLREISGCEFPSKFIEKAFQCSSNSFRAEGWVAIEFQMSDLCGNPVTYTSYIITHDLCNSCEWNCLADVLLIVEYGGSASDCVQSARTNTTSIVWVPSTVSGFHLLVPSRLELKFLSIGPTSVALLTVLLDSGNFASHWLVSCVCGPVVSSSNSFLRDEWVLSPWDPGQAVVSQFDKVFYSQDNFGIYPKNQMLQGLKISGSSDQFVIMRYPLNKVVMPCFNCKPLSMEKPRLYVADCSIPISGDLKEAMERMAISVLWKYLNQAKLKDSGTSISICLRFDSELEMTSVVQFMSSSYYTKVYDLLGEMHDSWENIIFNDSHSTCPSCLNDGVIYTFGICVAGQTFITYHKLQLLVQGISAELSIHEPSGRYCFSALFSLDLHRVIPLNGSGISSNVVLLSICGKFQGIGSHWQGSIHTEVVTFWLEYSFNRIDKMPQTRQSPHDHCSTGLQIRISVPKFFLCQLLLVMAPLIYLFEKQRLPTWPRPTAYCSLTGNMFSELDVSILALCESRLLNHQEMMQMLIGWPPSVHVNSITNELSCEDNESRCFLGWYDGGPALFLFRAFDRQLVYQGGRSAVISIIRYLVYDSYVANPDYLDSDGLKVLQAPRNPTVSNVALSAAFQEVQLHIPWDPGGSEISSVAQSLSIHLQPRLGDKPYFKEGGVSGTLYIPWANAMGRGPIIIARGRWVAEATNIRTGATETASRWITAETTLSSLFPCFSDSPSLLCSSPIPC